MILTPHNNESTFLYCLKCAIVIFSVLQGLQTVVFAGALNNEPVGGSIQLTWVRQKTASECGRAVLASLASRVNRNGKKSIDEIYSEIQKPSGWEKGISPPELIRLARKNGVALRELDFPRSFRGSSYCNSDPVPVGYLNRIRRSVDAGHPVVAMIINDAGSSHYVIVVGHALDRVAILDPAQATQRTGERVMPLSDFNARICEAGYFVSVASWP